MSGEFVGKNNKKDSKKSKVKNSRIRKDLLSELDFYDKNKDLKWKLKVVKKMKCKDKSDEEDLDFLDFVFMVKIKDGY